MRDRFAVKTLAASAARTASTNHDAIDVPSAASRCLVQATESAAATDAADTLDLYVDVSLDGGTTWLNAVHFTQRAGNAAGTTKEFAVLCPEDPGTAVVDASSDAASGVTRPSMWGTKMRLRSALVDSGDANTSHTYGVLAFFW